MNNCDLGLVFVTYKHNYSRMTKNKLMTYMDPLLVIGDHTIFKKSLFRYSVMEFDKRIIFMRSTLQKYPAV